MKISNKLKVQSLIVVILLVFNTIIVFLITNRTKSDVNKLSNVFVPLHKASYEMEINVNESSHGLLHFIRTKEDNDLDRIIDSKLDFDRFNRQFLNISSSSKMKNLGLKVTNCFNNVTQLGSEIIKLSTESHEKLILLQNKIEKIDSLIIIGINLSLDSDRVEMIKKIKLAMNLEVKLDNNFDLIYSQYLRTKKNINLENFQTKKIFIDFKRQYEQLNLTEKESKWLVTLDKHFNKAIKASERIVFLIRELNHKLGRYETHLKTIDQILDEEIQPQINSEEQKTWANVLHGFNFTMLVIVSSSILIIVIVLLISFFISKGIILSTNALAKGTLMFSKGNLDYRIKLVSKDELGLLSIAFNEMAEELSKVKTEVNKYRFKLEELVKQKTKKYKIELKKRIDAENKVKNSLKKEKELNKLKSRFVSTVSHEFRTPLTNISLTTELINNYYNEFSKEEIDEHFSSIYTSIDTLTNILEDLIIINMPENIHNKLSTTKFDFVNFSKTILNEVKNEYQETPLIEYNCNKKRKIIDSDKNKLRNILVNLISNAIKFTAPNKRINIDIIFSDNQLKINIFDQGLGISKDIHNKIFEPFFRSEKVNSIPGSGLGLSIVKKSVIALKGKISFSSIENEGSKFYVTIPLD